MTTSPTTSIPVNADIQDVDVILVPEKDNVVNPVGVKGIGELGNVGTAAAVANAVYHATGIRDPRAADPAREAADCIAVARCGVSGCACCSFSLIFLSS